MHRTVAHTFGRPALPAGSVGALDLQPQFGCPPEDEIKRALHLIGDDLQTFSLPQRHQFAVVLHRPPAAFWFCHAVVPSHALKRVGGYRARAQYQGPGRVPVPAGTSLPTPRNAHSGDAAPARSKWISPNPRLLIEQIPARKNAPGNAAASTSMK